MGIRPKGQGDVISLPPVSAQTELDSMVAESEGELRPASEALAEMAGKAESSSTGVAEVAQAVADLFSQPLLLWWDGTGDPPPLKPGWALLNTSNMQIIF